MARVCVTGLGVVAPNGIGQTSFWQSLSNGISGISRLTLFDTSEMQAQIAGEVKGFRAQDYLKKPVKLKRLARHTQFALVAANEALQDAGLEPLKPLGYELPVVMGVSIIGFDVIQRYLDARESHDPSRIPPYAVTEAPPQAPAAAIAKYLAVPSRVLTMSSACPAGLDAIAHAMKMIATEQADVAIAGGADSPLSPIPFANFSAAGMASCRNDAPELASRPFDRERDSGVISEGAGVVVLENLEHALARGARPYLELTGYSVKADEDPESPASGLSACMQQAIANAGLTANEIDYVCAHGPSHPVLDRVETTQIKEVFRDLAYTVPVSSIKGVLGNPLAAAGPLQVIACALAFRHGLIPPTANYRYPDPDCDLDYVPNEARRHDLETALINAHGVGGGNSAMVTRRVA